MKFGLYIDRCYPFVLHFIFIAGLFLLFVIILTYSPAVVKCIFGISVYIYLYDDIDKPISNKNGITAVSVKINSKAICFSACRKIIYI